MGSLSYVCWAFCLAQVALVYARPEFGTSLQFDESPDIRAATMRISELLDAMEGELNFTLSGHIAGSVAQRQLLVTFAESLADKGRDLADAFLSTVDATSGDFTPLLNAYDELISFIDNSGQAFYSSVSSSFSRLVAEELQDSFSDAKEGLLELRENLEDLANALEAEDVSSEEVELRHHLLREVLQTLYTIGTLNTVVCVFHRVADNMQTADSFYVAYEGEVNGLSSHLVPDLMNYGNDLYELAGSVDEKFDHLSSLYDTLGDQLGGYEDHSSDSSAQSAYSALLTSLHEFTDEGPAKLQSLVASFVPAALGHYLQDLFGTFQANYYQGPGLYAVANVLVEATIDSDVFAEFCFAKYAPQVANLPSLGHVQLHECLDTERPRLRKLARLVRSFVKLLSYDVEDLYLNLEPCFKRKHHRNRCFSQLAGFYTALGHKHHFKYRALKKLIKTELVAGRARLEICLAAANYYTFCHLLPKLIHHMNECFEERYCAQSCGSNESGPGSGSCSGSGPGELKAGGGGAMGSGEMESGFCLTWVPTSEMGEGSGEESGEGTK